MEHETAPTMQGTNLAETSNFGIIRMNLPYDKNEKVLFKVVRWMFSIDMSGSMESLCKDGKTKMEQVHHTLRNMMRCLVDMNKKNPQITQYVTIYGFDSQSEPLLKEEKVDDKLQELLPEILENLFPRGLTNIGVALDAMKPIIDGNVDTPFPVDEKVKTIHIFLTDGMITEGPRSPSVLKSKLANCTNIFLGYGSDHTDSLLSALADSPYGEYYFIENLEHAGSVYGEILYKGIHEILNTIILSAEHGEIYNYKTNTWSNELHIDAISAGQTRTWHVRTNSTLVKIKTQAIVSGTQQKIELETESTFPEEGQINQEVMNYSWRQRTQELMAEVKEHMGREIPIAEPVPHAMLAHEESPEEHLMLDAAKIKRWHIVWAILDVNPEMINKMPSPRRYGLLHHAVHYNNIEAVQNLLARNSDKNLKTLDTRETAGDIAHRLGFIEIAALLRGDEPKDYLKILNEFLVEMKGYMESNGLNQDEMMIGLCDDIYVTIRSMTSSLGTMFLEARCSAQGVQRAYNVSDLADLESSQTPQAAGWCGMGQTRGMDGACASHAPIHSVMQRTTTSNATPAAAALMRSCTQSDDDDTQAATYAANHSC